MEFLKQNWTYFVAVMALSIAGILGVATLIPLDSTPAVAGVTIITAVAYSISLAVWLFTIIYIAKGEKAESNLLWLNTHLMLLVVFPATIAATAMNVTTVQNTRNLLAGKIA